MRVLLHHQNGLQLSQRRLLHHHQKGLQLSRRSPFCQWKFQP
uniref:Uncharacterized protein n=1 Tax=Rhizophora mucronata TaxID=61149 RepID=A0A2P2Q3W5_RHIMU